MFSFRFIPLGFNVGLQHFLSLTLMLCLVLFCFHGNEMALVILTELMLREIEKNLNPILKGNFMLSK